MEGKTQGNGMTFGRYFRQLRLKNRKPLREFCLENDLDPGNVSKLERDRIKPPQSREALERYAHALGLEEGSDEWYQFFDLAAIAAQRLPPTLLNDKEILARLPLVCRTLRNAQMNGDDLDKLIELIREN